MKSQVYFYIYHKQTQNILFTTILFFYGLKTLRWALQTTKFKYKLQRVFVYVLLSVKYDIT